MLRGDEGLTSADGEFLVEAKLSSAGKAWLGWIGWEVEGDDGGVGEADTYGM
jgi:hypothetical protein